MSRPSEDALIARFFAPLASEPGAAALTDDAAVLPAGPGELVVTKDMLVAGVHFFPDDPPDLVARKALRVNLSDLAAKGAVPTGFLIGLGLAPDWTEAFLASFAGGLGADIDQFGCPLFGGDTVKVPGPLTLSITAFGRAKRTVRRDGAWPGDLVVVTGTIGDGALGLVARAAEREPAGAPGWLGALDEDQRAALRLRYLQPEPRCALAEAVSAHASAAMDISDGFAGDLAKLAAASGAGAEIDVAAVPLSLAARAALVAAPDAIGRILTGGDDYEILATVPPKALPPFEAAARAAGVPVTVVGKVTPGHAVVLRGADGKALDLGSGRFEHF